MKNNKDERYTYIMDNVNRHLQEVIKDGYEWVFIAVQGSQNYNLDIYDKDYVSDIDTKVVVLPKFEDIIKNKQPVSFTKVLDNNEHIDVKDIRAMFETYKKQNVNFIETIFTPYKIVNEKYADLIKPLFENKEKIAHLNINQALRCMAGMSMEKLKALQHPYPTIIDKIEKFGYDPKQLHHILRMNDFIKKYAESKPYEDCLIPDNINYLIDIKKGKLPIGEAVKLANEVDKDTNEIKNKYVTEKDVVDGEAIYMLEDIIYLILKRKFKEEITGRW